VPTVLGEINNFYTL